ncbi:patatin-like phospholipase [Nitzschia inconspicua]|uniref:Patatin-like phospholipase n=1 Tax=Nitzschia inconspicua TaxID=303405 RepID=A0A9K3KRC0_9STRA|nr:patatin-like phospholipase [Nitzschia inconspicua]
MEILIQVPPWVVSYWDYTVERLQFMSLKANEYSRSIYAVCFQNQRNFVAIALSMFLFWPFYAYCFVAVTTASTWIFWLFASVLMGLVQMCYVSYQFCMIAVDIFVLTLLKTYQVIMRSRTAQFIFFFSKKIRNSRIKLSRRREWREQCEAAKDYDSFLRIPVLENAATLSDTEPIETRIEESQKLSAMRKSRSYATMETLKEHTNEDQSHQFTEEDSPGRLRRRSSLSKLKSFRDEQELQHDQRYLAVARDLGPSTADLLLSTTERLAEERIELEKRRDSGLEFLLSGVVKRNHLTLEDLLVSNARSVAVSGQYQFSATTRKAIAAYYTEVRKGLEALGNDSTIVLNSTLKPSASSTLLSEVQNRIKLLRKMKQNMGRTALMLSGGGAQAMYHLGTIRALIQSDLYNNIKVISGTSGGSIAAACCAMFSPKEILDDICVSTVSTDYGRNGEMKRKNIRWFPPMADMVSYWLKKRLLVDSKYFFTTCEFYWGTTTFAEAFERTGKHVCITVSASRANSGSAQRLLLNHISTPHVTLASAVAASCALPGVMKPRKLQTKNSMGEIEDFEVDGVEWIDGSVQADLPFQRIATLFNVSNFVVCQTNFHVLPFLNKEHHPDAKSNYWKMFQTIEWDIRNRALKLSRLGLFPKLFGQDISKVFKQKYHGNLTLVPRFTAMQTFGLAALVNPTVTDMENYLKFGQIAAWPYLCVIRDMISLERALDEALDSLRGRLRELRPDTDLSTDLDDDEVDSIASSIMNALNAPHRFARTVRFDTSSREIDVLKKKLSLMQQENQTLKDEVIRLKSLIGHSDMASEEKKDDDTKNNSAQIRSEGGVLKFIRGSLSLS